MVPKSILAKIGACGRKLNDQMYFHQSMRKKLAGHPRTEGSNLMKSWASLVLKYPSMVLSLLAPIVEQKGITEVVASYRRLGSGLNYNLKTIQMWIMAKKEDQLKVLKHQLLAK